MHPFIKCPQTIFLFLLIHFLVFSLVAISVLCCHPMAISSSISCNLSCFYFCTLSSYFFTVSHIHFFLFSCHLSHFLALENAGIKIINSSSGYCILNSTIVRQVNRYEWGGKRKRPGKYTKKTQS